MDFDQIYQFLFQSYAGVGILVAIFLVISILACFLMERRTRKVFVDRKKTADDWSLFDDDDEEDEEAENK